MANNVDMDCIISGGDFVVGNVRQNRQSNTINIPNSADYEFYLIYTMNISYGDDGIITVTNHDSSVAQIGKGVVMYYSHYDSSPTWSTGVRVTKNQNNMVFTSTGENFKVGTIYNYILWNDPT